MINLLNVHDKKEFRSAKRNTLWVKYIFLAIVALVILLFMSAITFLVFDAEENTQKQIEATNSQKNALEVTETKKMIDNFTKNTQTLDAIEKNRIRYSEILVNLAKALPSGCVLTTISLTGATLGTTPQNLEANCAAEGSTSELKRTDQQILKNVQIISVNRDPTKSNGNVKISFSAIIQKPSQISGGTP
jgi:Tfp pilus assembly protein PilN